MSVSGFKLLALPRELIQVVVYELYETHKISLFSVLRVNKLLYEVVLPYTVRQCTLHFSQQKFEDTNARVAQWLDDGGSVCDHTQHLIIYSPKVEDNPASKFYAEMAWVDWINVTTLISRLVRLQALTFDCPTPIPHDLDELLRRSKPDIRLYVRDWTRRTQDRDASNPEEVAPLESPMLRSLHAFHPASDSGDMRWAAFLRLVQSSPNLEAVRYEPLNMESYKSVRPAEHRKAQYEAFFSQRYPKRDIKVIYVDGQEFFADVLDSVNLDCIEELGLLRIGETWANGISSSLLALKKLEVLFEPVQSEDPTVLARLKDKVSEFFAEIPALESLTIHGPRDAMPELSELLSRHGPTLRRLYIHEREPSTNTPWRVPTREEIAEIRSACPCLTDLGIDLDLDMGQQHIDDICELLARPPSLRNVTINLDVAVKLLRLLGEYRRFQDIAGMKTIGEQVFRRRSFVASRACDIWRAVAAKGTRLAQLSVRKGEPDHPIWLGQDERRPLGMTRHEGYRVTPCARDDQLDEVEVEQIPWAWMARQTLRVSERI
ncbi:hypothetical protein EV121DRAFT_294374 [Schizophyllum commune]